MNVLKERCSKYTLTEEGKKAGIYPYHRAISSKQGTEVIMEGRNVLMFGSNSYLGLTNHPKVIEASVKATEKYGSGCAGSRYLNGTLDIHRDFEAELAEFVGKDDAIIYSTGFQTNLGVISSLTGRDDYIVCDELDHASIVDGRRLSFSKPLKFKHNDIESCEQKLKAATQEAEQSGGGILLITEGVFGMTGALGILDRIVALKKKYKFRILIDDAHGFGVMGPNGRGTSEHFGVMDDIDIYIGAYAKSMATIGGFVASEKEIITYLRYNMRSQMYAKSLPMPIVEGCLKRLEIIRSAEGDSLRARLWEVTRSLQDGFRELGYEIGPAEACVTPVHLMCGVNQATNIAVDLREHYGIFCSIVTYPVIPPGMLIFRIIPTAAHSMEDVRRTLSAFKDIKERLDRGEYDKDMPDMALMK